MESVKSVYNFEQDIRNKINSDDLNGALKYIHLAVEQIFCEPLNSTQIFGSRLLDDFCQEIGRVNLKKIIDNRPIQQSSKQSTIYIATKLQASGGHTAVLADFIRMSSEANVHVLVTGLDGSTDKDSILHRFKGIENLTFEYAPKVTHIKKLDWLQARIQELNPKDVWLFNHHHDSVAIAAVQSSEGYKIHFYHHGDHNLSLGVYLRNVDHIDPHPMGFHNCREYLGINDNRYIPLTVSDLGVLKKSKFPSDPNHKLITCTAARSNKVEVNYFIRYVDVIPEMLRASRGVHIHIGNLSYIALWTIKRRIKGLGLDPKSFIYIPYVPSLWKFFLDNKVDLYIASFPYGGGRTIIEVMGAGIPVAVHSHCLSRFLGGFDMVYEEAFVWRYPEELYRYISNIDFKVLESQSVLARATYLKYHTESIVIDCINNKSNKKVSVPNLRAGYTPDLFQRSVNISNEFGYFRIVKLYMYKKYRWWRSCFS